MVDFLERVLGLSRTHTSPGIVSLTTVDGDTVEVFTVDEPDHGHFTTGPVVGLLVDDVEGGRRQLEQAGVELLGSVERGGGMMWQHFRAPDGNVWEITRRAESNGQ